MSRWERDLVYPTWAHQPRLIQYLGYDPFTQPELGRPKGNETTGVAILLPEASDTFGALVQKQRLESRKNKTEFAKILGVDPKTLRDWERGVHTPFPRVKEQMLRILAAV